LIEAAPASATMTILLVEDDPKTALYVTEALQKQAHTVRWAATGTDGLAQARDGNNRLLIIDRMLPRLDGLSLLRRLRGEGYRCPVLMLTAMGDTDDRVEGLEAGADDYLSKPFAIAELQARVNALLRRPLTLDEDVKPTRLRLGGLELDLLARTTTRDGERIELQDQEFQLLKYLMAHPGGVVTRKMVLENVWGLNFDPRSNIVESHISRIRAKVDRGFPTKMIRTVRGVGYKISA
jgi:two-component system OmpR family response regulator